VSIVFNQKSIVMSYLQNYLKEDYNRKIKLNGEYYVSQNIDYGMAHYIAKYLDYMYPIIDQKQADIPTKKLTDIISIKNYFLCNNHGGKLRCFDDISNNKLTDDYMKLYNTYSVPEAVNIGSTDSPTYAYRPKLINGEVDMFNYKDTPLFFEYDGTDITYKDDISYMASWGIDKGICEIDDLVLSYLLGRTISPNSSRDEIYYVQKLFLRDFDLTRHERGVWNNEDERKDLTAVLTNYQRQRVNYSNSLPIFVTGYFDIFTEKFALLDYGVDSNAIYGL